MELVSVIIPVYNVEAYLDQCIQSVQEQTYRRLEIILVDDGSTDRSGAMCDAYAAQDARIAVFHKPNAGLGFARNTGLAAATGAYVAFVDADDWIDERMIEILVSTMEGHCADMAGCAFDQDAVGARMSRVSRANRFLRCDGHARIVAGALCPMLGSDAVRKNPDGREMSVCTNLYRKAILDGYQITFVSEREYLTEDLFFNIPYLMHCERIVYLPDKLYFYRHNPASLSKKYRADKVALLIHMTETMLCLLRREGLEGQTGQRVQRAYFKRLRNCLMQISASEIPASEKRRQYRAAVCAALTRRFARAYPCARVPLKEAIFVLLIRLGHCRLLTLYLGLQRRAMTWMRGK